MSSMSLLGGGGTGPSAATVVGCKALSGCILFIYAAVLTGFVATGAGLDAPYSETICGYTYGTKSDYRTSGVLDAMTLYSSANDGAGLYTEPEVVDVNMFNVLWIAIAALYFSGIWLCCLPAGMYYFTSAEARDKATYYTTIELDFNWYRWIHWTITHPLWFVVLLIVAGASNVWVITLAAFVAVAMLIFLAYNEGSNKIPNQFLTEVRSGKSNTPSRNWEAFCCSVVFLVVLGAAIFSYAASSVTAEGGIAAIDAENVTGVASMLLAATISGYVLYFCVLILCGIAAHTYLGWCGPARSKELWYECIYFVFVTVVTWIIAGFALSTCVAPVVAP